MAQNDFCFITKWELFLLYSGEHRAVVIIIITGRTFLRRRFCCDSLLRGVDFHAVNGCDENDFVDANEVT